MDSIKNALSSTDWDSFLEGKTETAWNDFKNLILSLADANIPKMNVSGTEKLKPVWLSNWHSVGSLGWPFPMIKYY